MDSFNHEDDEYLLRAVFDVEMGNEFEWDEMFDGELEWLEEMNQPSVIDISSDDSNSVDIVPDTPVLFTDDDDTDSLPSLNMTPESVIVISDDELDHRNGEPQSQQIGAGEDPDLFRFVAVRRVFSAKFHVYVDVLDVMINPNVAPQHDWLERFVGQIIDEARRRFDIQNDELLRIEINHPGLTVPILYSFRPMGEVTIQDILDAIEVVLQSCRTFVLDDRTRISLIYVPQLRGGGEEGNQKKKILNVDFLESKIGRTLLAPANTHKKFKMCFPLSVVLGINELRHANAKDPSVDEVRIYKDTKKNPRTNPLQLRKAFALCQSAGVDTRRPCGVNEWRKIQEVLQKEYKIFIYDFHSNYSEIFEGNADDGTTPLRLLLKDSHFYYIRLMHSLFGKSHFCYICHAAFDKKEHKCKDKCRNCKSLCKSKDGVRIKCDDCGRSFKGQECFDNHRVTKEGGSVCENSVACKICYATVQRGTKHVCGLRKCHNCGMDVLANHRCYLQPLKTDETVVRFYVFFDFETYLDDNKVHVPCLCIAQRVCPECISLPLDEQCSACVDENPVREYVFYGENCLQSFGKWVVESETIERVSEKNRKRKKVTVFTHRNTIFMSHNGRAFDMLFVLRFLCEETNSCPKILGTGTRINSISFTSNIKFLDSLNFIPIPLRKFSSTFGLPLSKGTFPYSFLNLETLNYAGPLPELSYYDSRNLSPKGVEELREWYEQRRLIDYFDTRKELIEYCRDDVTLLRGGCAAFMTLFYKLTGIKPFHSSITIASLAMRVYRTNFLPKFTIATTQPQCHINARKQSFLALRHLQYLEYSEKIKIQHARNGGEQRVQSLSVDGMYRCPVANRDTVVEILGCVFHGCILCQKNRDKKHPFRQNQTMDELYRDHLERTQRLENENYHVRMIWECEIKQIRKSEAYKEFDRVIPSFTEPLEIRDSFFGGRVNALKLYKCIENDERIYYFDVTSLYPFVQKTRKYAIGHPTVIVTNFQNLKDYFGFVKCTVLPPRDLYIPVLPVRVHGKNVYPLCRTCAALQQTQRCQHAESARILHGTWFSEELKEAVRKCYVVKEIFEIYHYNHTRQYNPHDTPHEADEESLPKNNLAEDGRDIPEDELYATLPKNDLFSEYINLFLKIKTEASGYPAELNPTCDFSCEGQCEHIDWDTINANRERFIDDFFEREHVRLEKGKIAYNSSLRFIAKLFLNSLWGKFSERVDNRSQLLIVSSAKKFYDLVYNGNHTIQHIELLGPTKVLVAYRASAKNLRIPPHVNVAIGSITTAYGRLELYKYLDMLGDRVLYFDTDSVIYTQKPNDQAVPSGSYLGDLTDEMPPHCNIVAYCSTGPKSYSLKILNQKTGEIEYSVKSKGITLNHETSKLINFEALKEMVHNREKSVHVTYPNAFHRTKDFKVYMKDRTKTLQLKYDKRVRVPNSYDTVPYGYTGALS